MTLKMRTIAKKNSRQCSTSLLEKMNQDNSHIEVKSLGKPARHHQPEIKGLHQIMVQMYGGINLTTIAGINDSTLLRLLGEVGNGYEPFPEQKTFCQLGRVKSQKQAEWKNEKTGQMSCKSCRTYFSSISPKSVSQ